MSDLGSTFAREISKINSTEPFMTAVVTIANPFSIRISGSAVAVPVPAGVTLAWYTPVVGDVVILARNDSTFIVLGKAS